MIKNNQEYYLLTLSHKRVKLYKGNKYLVDLVNISGLPSNMKETLNIDEYPNWRETHTIAPSSHGKGSEAYHGQYNVRQTDKLMLHEFFRRIDKHLHNFLRDKHEPLLIAGVAYLLPIYQAVNTYPYLLDHAPMGNLERATLDELHEKTWPIIKLHRSTVQKT